MSQNFMQNLENITKDIRIRNYKISDYQDTLEILKDLHETYGLTLNKKQWTKSSGLRQFKPNLKRITLVVELKSTGKVIGMGVIESLKNVYGESTGYLNNWAIRKENIGQHVGKMLADNAIEILKSWGCKSIRINLGYGVPEKLINVFGHAGFKPIMIVLEKNVEETDKDEEKNKKLKNQDSLDKKYHDQKLITSNR